MGLEEDVKALQMIVKLLLENLVLHCESCDRYLEGDEKYPRTWPFAAEIRGDMSLHFMCNGCRRANAENI